MPRNPSFILFALLALPLVRSVGKGSEAVETGGANELRVLVNVLSTNVQVGKPFKVSFRVENPAPTNQSVGVWSCSWSDNWKTDNTNLILFGQSCNKNVVWRVKIKPGAAYTNEGEMQVLQPVSGNSSSFRMGFTPYIDSDPSFRQLVWGKTLWSEEVVITNLLAR